RARDPGRTDDLRRRSRPDRPGGVEREFQGAAAGPPRASGGPMTRRRWMGTIGGKLLLLVAATGTVTAVLVSIFVLSRTYARDRQNIVESVMSDAAVLAIHCEALLLFEDPVAAEETLASL